MAILKHITSKNADYRQIQQYLLFQHDEYTGKTILDKNGEPIPRGEYYLDGINCDPFTFDVECWELNARFHKNQDHNEIKSHHYIISFDPEDVKECGLTGEKAQQLCLEYAKRNFPGHQTLVCTHTDGHNKSGNIHAHIVLNSLRKCDVERQDFMERGCDSRAGYKHHLTKDLLAHLKQDVMDMCRSESLHQVDLLAPAEKKITEREYHAKRRGQKKLDDRNSQMIAGGIAPRKTTFQTQKDEIRAAVDAAAATARSPEEFEKLLSEKYGIALKISRGRFSYLHPERTKAITGRNLGTRYEETYLLDRFRNNAIGLPIYTRTNLRLVTDLQKCVKAQQSRAYARKVKLTNLQQMAQTVAYVQEHGYDSRQELLADYAQAQEQASHARQTLRATEQALRETNKQIRFTGQYLANKSVYGQFLKAKNKARFRREHQQEIGLYEEARKILKGYSEDGKLPSMKHLKAEKDRLIKEKDRLSSAYENLRQRAKELKTVCSNVDMILGKKELSRAKELRKPEIS